MVTLNWLSEDNVAEMTEITLSKHRKNMVAVGDENLFRQILENKNHFSNLIDINYAIIKDEQGNTVGVTGFYIPKEDPNAAWLGWIVIKSEYDENLYIKKSLEALFNYIGENYPNVDTIRFYTNAVKTKYLDFYKDMGFIPQSKKWKIEGNEEPFIVLNYGLNGTTPVEWDKMPIW